MNCHCCFGVVSGTHGAGPVGWPLEGGSVGSLCPRVPCRVLVRQGAFTEAEDEGHAADTPAVATVLGLTQ